MLGSAGRARTLSVVLVLGRFATNVHNCNHYKYSVRGFISFAIIIVLQCLVVESCRDVTMEISLHRYVCACFIPAWDIAIHVVRIPGGNSPEGSLIVSLWVT